MPNILPIRFCKHFKKFEFFLLTSGNIFFTDIWHPELRRRFPESFSWTGWELQKLWALSFKLVPASIVVSFNVLSLSNTTLLFLPENWLVWLQIPFDSMFLCMMRHFDCCVISISLTVAPTIQPIKFCINCKHLIFFFSFDSLFFVRVACLTENKCEY